MERDSELAVSGGLALVVGELFDNDGKLFDSPVNFSKGFSLRENVRRANSPTRFFSVFSDLQRVTGLVEVLFPPIFGPFTVLMGGIALVGEPKISSLKGFGAEENRCCCPTDPE